MPRKPKDKTIRKRGGQPGNKNALSHGFYSKYFKPEETKRLYDQETTDLSAEINLLRVSIDRLANQISYDPIKRTDSNGTSFRDSHYLNQLNTLALMAQSISTLVRTIHLIKGRSGTVHDSILQALEELRLEMGL
jgi:hypothetical protein